MGTYWEQIGWGRGGGTHGEHNLEHHGQHMRNIMGSTHEEHHHHHWGTHVWNTQWEYDDGKNHRENHWEQYHGEKHGEQSWQIGP